MSRTNAYDQRYPALERYALVGDCHSVALVSEAGSIDWLCMPRMDSSSVFARILDWERGGHFSIFPAAPDVEVDRRYRDHSLILETTYRTAGGSARVIDCFSMRRGGRRRPHRSLVRVVEGLEGRVEFEVNLAARLEYGMVRPWVREAGRGDFTLVGGAAGLVISGDFPLVRKGRHDLTATFAVGAGERARIGLTWRAPETLTTAERVGADDIETMLEDTDEWWRTWLDKAAIADPAGGTGLIRSGAILKALTNAPTGAIAAAATTSLPETIGGRRNWDYRFSWIRDSVFAARALTRLGMTAEADGFRRFVERSAAGNAEDLQVVYGVGGETRLHETTIDTLVGYRGSTPVRVGNDAYRQIQLDTYGHVLELSWRWVQRGQNPDDDYWEFIEDIARTICERWRSPDRGIWEVRGEPQHFVHSKVMCWAGLNAAIRSAESTGRPSHPTWKVERDSIRAAVLDRGVNRRKSHFVRSFDVGSLDAALLLIPTTGFVDWSHPLMVGTVDAVRDNLERDLGFVLRYRESDGLEGRENAFLACSFWLAEALAEQRRLSEAREVFNAAEAVASPLGLFAEEYDLEQRFMTGNYPQGLTHLAHINAGLALDASEAPRRVS